MIRTVSRFAAKMAVSAWFVTMVGGSAIMLGRHMIALPKPATTDHVLAQSLAQLKLPDDHNDTLVVHVLYSKCACSKAIATHLANSKRPSHVTEIVLLAGAIGDAPKPDEFETSLMSKFRIIHVSTNDLHSKYHVDAAPLMVVVGANDSIDYLGGYTTEKQGADIHDLDVITRARAHSPSESLPVFGCAVSEQLKKQLDPTNIL